MAKNSISDYDTTAANNTDIQSVDVSEGCPASGINNAIREMMADTADAFTQGTPIALDQTNNRVGIGTTAPQSDLSVKVSASRQLDVIKDSGDDHLVLKSSAPDASYNLRSIELAGEKVAFSTGASSGTSYTERMRIDSSGFVGINETSPNAGLHVTTSDFKAVQVEGPRPTMFFKETDGSADENYQIRIDGGDLLFQQQNDAQSNAANVIKCRSDKNVVVGSEISGGTTSFVVNNNSSGRALDVKRDTSTSSNHIANFYSNVGGNNTIQAVIEASGDVESRTNNFTGTSDQTLKENIADANSQWDDIKALQVKNYNFIGEPERTCIGVIAQEVQAAGMNGLVKTSSETGKMSVKYSVLYMKAVKALQEAMTKIETLETEMTALKARVTALEDA